MRVVAALGLAGCLACGSTTRNPGQEAQGGSASGGSAGQASVGGATGGSPLENELKVPPSPMRRLTAFEYEATVSDVLGVSGVVPNVRRSQLGVFDNNPEVQHTAPDEVEALLTSAESAARQLFADAALKARLPACPADNGCVARFVKDLSLSLFRRPASEEELKPYVGVYDAAIKRGVPHAVALEQVLVSLLVGSQFLFRMELLPDSGAVEAPLDSYAVATRLSYLLWSSAPDAALLEAAAQDELQTDAGVRAAFERLLADPRSRRFVESFAGQWLGLQALATHPVAPEYAPSWDPDLENEVTNEGYAYFEGFLRSEQPWQRFLRDPIPAAGPLRAARYTADAEPRLGFLSLPAFLAVTSLDRRTSPTTRGKFLRTRLLCWPLPPPTPDVPSLPTDFEQLSFRERVEAISADSSCASCHVLTDPLGLALEHYDLVGQYRTHYADDGVAVDTVVQLPPHDAYPNGLSLTGLNDVSEFIATDPAFMTCLMEQLYTYGLAHVPREGVDDGNVALLAERWQEDGPSLPVALSTVVESKPFRFRNLGGTP